MKVLSVSLLLLCVVTVFAVTPLNTNLKSGVDNDFNLGIPREGCAGAKCEHHLNSIPQPAGLSRTIMVSGLPSGITDMDVTNKFALGGSLEQVKLLGHGKALITYSRLEAAKQAYHRLNGSIFHGTKVSMSFQCNKGNTKGCDVTDYSKPIVEKKK